MALNTGDAVVGGGIELPSGNGEYVQEAWLRTDFVRDVAHELGKTQHRFEIHDPFAETTFRFNTASTAVAKAEELGFSGFQGRDGNDKVSQIKRIDGHWVREDGKSLADVQTEIDKDGLKAIETRVRRRAEIGQYFDTETDKQMAVADAYAFGRLQNHDSQKIAASYMANNTRQYPDYKAGLDNAIPGYSGTAAKVYALDATHDEKDAAKNSPKAVEVSDVDRRVVAPSSMANDPVQPRDDKANDASRGAAMAFDAVALQRVAAGRARDIERAADEMGLNGIEPAAAVRVRQGPEGTAEAVRPAVKGQQGKTDAPPNADLTRDEVGNRIVSDNVFADRGTEGKPVVPKEIEDRYLRIGDKFYHPKNTDVVAFEDKGNRLETRSNSEQVAETMVTIARARGWEEIKVSGTETFRKEVWLEAAAHGMQVRGFTPSEQDKVQLAKRTGEIEANRVEAGAGTFRGRETDSGSHRQNALASEAADEQARGRPQTDADGRSRARAQAFAQQAPAEAVKAHPELAGSYAAAAAIERRAEADGLSEAQRAVVMARVRQNIVNSIERDQLPQMLLREEVQVQPERRPQEQEAAR